MRVVGYIRVSTEEQAAEGVSLPCQREKLRLYCDLHGLELVEVIADEGASGKNLDRPGIRRVLELLDGNAIDGLLITKLDRLTRSLTDWGAMIDDYFDERGRKKLFSVQDHIDTSTATGRMMINIILTFAQWEREVNAERTTDALRSKIARGERCGKVRYGHDLDWSGPRNDRERPVMLSTNDHEQRGLALMTSLRAEGSTYRQIARALQTAGFRTKEGHASWHPDSVRKILLKRGVA